MKPRAYGGMSFDPALCPLLDGLSEDEQRERMHSDPMIRACIGKLEKGTGQLDGCHVKSAYAARRAKAKAGQVDMPAKAGVE